jgi:hypothetical protein
VSEPRFGSDSDFYVKLICSGRGSHPKVVLGTYFETKDGGYAELGRSAKEPLTGDLLRLDEKCERCGRHALLSARSLRRISREFDRHPPAGASRHGTIPYFDVSKAGQGDPRR